MIIALIYYYKKYKELKEIVDDLNQLYIEEGYWE